MEFSRNGALMQAFVIDALGKWSDIIASKKPEELDTPFIAGHAWKACALELQEALNKKYGRSK
jgi:hypothetical protein